MFFLPLLGGGGGCLWFNSPILLGILSDNIAFIYLFILF